MSRNKRVIAFLISAAGVSVCSLALFAVIIQTQGVVIYDPKYHDSKGPFSYTFHDWISEMLLFLPTVCPFIFGITAAVFGLYWWLNRSETQTKERAVSNAAHAALVSFSFLFATFSVGEVLIYTESSKRIERLNKYGPPR
jgi:cytochrome bd-type quinol oxidase subunit 2